MAVVADTQRAVNVLQGLQGRLIAAGDPELGEQFASMIDLLESPTFRHLLTLQQSCRELQHHLDSGPPGQTIEDIGFGLDGGLVLPDQESDAEPEQPYRISIGPQHPYAFENKMFEGDDGAMVTKTAVAPVASAPPPQPQSPPPDLQPDVVAPSPQKQEEHTRSIPLERANEDLEQALRELALGREVLSIELSKQEGRGLGFSVVGLKSENQGELGIFVQQIQKNGVAARDGRLHESDQILAINGALVDSSVSHKQAIGMLQKVKDKVNLIVARGGLHLPTPPRPQPHPATATPTTATLAGGIVNDLGRGSGSEGQVPIAAAVGASSDHHEEPVIAMDLDLDVHAAPPQGDLDGPTMLTPDIEVIDLYNQGSGLGFGIVGVRDIGIVVKTIVPGGAAEGDGRLQSGDIILRIGETDLEGMTSDQVASVLRQSGSHVQLVVARGALAVMQPSPPPGGVPLPGEGENLEEEEGMEMEEEEEEKGVETRMPPHGLDLGQGGEIESEPLPVSPPPNLTELTSDTEIVGDIFEVELVKGSYGLGLSIAGFIKKTPDGGETSGIFVKKIADGSAADTNGNIRVGDQIIEVDGVNVQGYDNKAAVDLLRRTGGVVLLRLARFPPDPPLVQEPLIQAQDAPLPDLAPPSLHDLESPTLHHDEIPELPCPFSSHEGTVQHEPPSQFSPHEGDVENELVSAFSPHENILENELLSSFSLHEGDIENELVSAFSPHENAKENELVSAFSPHENIIENELHSPFSPNEGDIEHELTFPFSPPEVAVEHAPPMEILVGELSPEEEIAIMAFWQGLLGLEKDIVIAQLSKFEEGGSLGISLEGTVDIDESGQEVQPHHYIRSILPDGPVDQNGLLASGDELLEVNGLHLLGLNHEEVVKILKDLPQHVRLVCARHLTPVFPGEGAPPSNVVLATPGDHDFDSSGELQLPHMSLGSEEPAEVEAEISANVSASMDMTTPMLPALDDSGSPLDYSLQTDTSQTDNSHTDISQSRESMWSDEIQHIELVKGDRGLGFSILDYQDPDNPAASVIVIRSLVPGGVAEQNGRLIPGDRLVSVNQSNLENCSLDAAVQVLMGAPTGLVRIGVAKPAAWMEGEENQVVNATPAMVQESSPPAGGEGRDDQDTPSPAPPTATPMLPDVDISPLAAAVMAREAVEEAQGEVQEELEVEHKPLAVEVPDEPAIVAAEVSLAHSAAPLPATPPATPPSSQHQQQPALPPDLVSSIPTPEEQPPASSLPPTQPAAPVKEIEKPPAPATPPHPKRTPPKPPPKPLLRPTRSYHSPSSSSSSSPRVGSGGPNPRGPLGFSPPSSSHGGSSPRVGGVTVSVSPLGQAPEDRLPKMVPMKATPPSGRRKTSNVVLPVALEETIVLRKTNAGLGLTVSADKANGVAIKSIIRGGCVQQDGRLSVGDYITAVNGENMRNLTNNTARGVLRRSFLQGSDITVTYIPAGKASELIEGGAMSSDSSMGTPPPSAPYPATAAKPAESMPDVPPTPSSSEAVLAPPSGESQWGEVKTVTVNKEAGRSLGISIVGGRAGSDGQGVQGIFIKHVLESSPAGWTGQLKTGDRILEVNGCDLREATHDQAVAVIRNASNPMHFQVQSLTVGSPAPILDEDSTDGGVVGVVAVAATVVQAGADSDDNLDDAPDRKDGEEDSDSETEDEFGYTWKRLTDRYKDFDGELHVFELTKGERGLGLSLAGNKDRSKTSVFVVGVNPTGAAGKDGRIVIGDELLEINGIKVHGHSHQNASSIIGGLAPGVVKCVILRNKDSLNQLAVSPVIYPSQTSIATVQAPQQAPDETDSALPPGAPEPEPERPLPTPADYPNVASITLTKGPRGLGFAIYENQDEKGLSGIFVKDVTMGGPAASEGHLKMGDQILAVNDKSVIGLSKLSAISVLKDTRGKVTLTVSCAQPGAPHHGSLGRGLTGAQLGLYADPQPQTYTSQGNYFPALDLGADYNGLPDLSSTNPDQHLAHSAFFPPLESEPHETDQSASFIIKNLDLQPSHSAYSDPSSASDHKPDHAPPSDPLTCPVVKGHRTLIVVDRGHGMGLGVSIAGGTDTNQPIIVIDSIQPEGAAARDGRLQPGDQLLEVDGLELKDITHEAALNVLRQTSSKVRMLVLREDPPPVVASPPQEEEEEGVKGEEEEEGPEGAEVMTVVLHQPAGQSLGLSIAGKAGALYVSDIAKGSVAASSGQLMRGDQILGVNGQAVKNIPQEALASLRQNAEGDVSLKIARQKDGGGSRLSMSSFETIVNAQPVTVDSQPTSPESKEARAVFLAQQESFGSSTELPPEETSSSGVKTVTLERGPDGLGFSIVGGYGSPHGDLPIYIKTVFNRGAAAVAKQLKRGDQILSVNGETLEGATHQMAVTMLKKAKGQVTLTIVS